MHHTKKLGGSAFGVCVGDLQASLAAANPCSLQAVLNFALSVCGAVLAGRGAKRVRHEEDDYDDFVVDDEEEPDWRQALKSVTRYDPSK